MDCDENERDCGFSAEELKSALAQSLQGETDMLRTYTILAERVHENEELKERLRNFAEGNAKRSQQLMDEIQQLS